MHGFELISDEASVRISDKSMLICPYRLKKYDVYNVALNLFYRDGKRCTDDERLIRIVRGFGVPDMAFLEFGGVYYANGDILKFLD